MPLSVRSISATRRGSEAEVGRWKEDGRTEGRKEGRMKGKEASRGKSWETTAKRLSARSAFRMDIL